MWALLAAGLTMSSVAGLSCEDNRGQGGAFRMLQPDNMDLIMHGAGQDPTSFREYWNFMPNDTKPMLFMAYTQLNASSEADVQAFFAGVERECASYGDDHYVLPQIGLSMSSGGQGYDGAVAAGQLDEQITWLANALGTVLTRPAYVRIGYEFNGQWNGYSPKTYVKAFERIASKIRVGKTVATVWDFSADASGTPAHGRENWINWVVNESLRDWVGINIFSGHSQPTAPASGVKGSRSVELFLEDVTDSVIIIIAPHRMSFINRPPSLSLAGHVHWLACVMMFTESRVCVMASARK